MPDTPYEIHAHAFLQARDPSAIGTGVLQRWAGALKPGSEVLELACGGGLPVTRELQSAGLRVWAIDASATLVAAFHSRFPDIPVQCATVQASDFFARRFDAVVAVGLMFLLPEAEQAALLANVAATLNDGGRFLFTAPLETCSWQDTLTGQACCSLGRQRYEECFSECGLQLVSTFSDEGGNNHYDALRVR